MIIKAVKFRKDGFYTQPFIFGGEEGMEKFDKNIRYRGSLQNYLIDTGDEVILVDTGLPAGTPEEVPNENSPIFTGKDICSYMEAFAALGYKPEQVTKILLTHKHADHSGELKSFPNAKIYVNAEEIGADELKGLDNIIPVTFTDGAYYNFPDSQKIANGVYFIKAKGHTNGNSIIIVEDKGLFYMLHGDITYMDEALHENKLSIVFDDISAARETLDRVREEFRIPRSGKPYLRNKISHQSASPCFCFFIHPALSAAVITRTVFLLRFGWKTCRDGERGNGERGDGERGNGELRTPRDRLARNKYRRNRTEGGKSHDIRNRNMDRR